jgi:hypothetical protein
MYIQTLVELFQNQVSNMWQLCSFLGISVVWVPMSEYVVVHSRYHSRVLYAGWHLTWWAEVEMKPRDSCWKSIGFLPTEGTIFRVDVTTPSVRCLDGTELRSDVTVFVKAGAECVRCFQRSQCFQKEVNAEAIRTVSEIMALLRWENGRPSRYIKSTNTRCDTSSAAWRVCHMDIVVYPQK